MYSEILTAKAEGPCFIQNEEKEALQEILSLCYYKNASQIKKYWKAVFKVGQCTSLDNMTMDNFDVAFTVARKILQDEGVKVFKPRRSRISNEEAKSIQNGKWGLCE